MTRLYRAASFEEAAKVALTFCIKNRKVEDSNRDFSHESEVSRLICIRLYENGRLVGAQLIYEDSPEQGPLVEARAYALPGLADWNPAFGVLFSGEDWSGFVPSTWDGTADSLL